MGEKRIGIILVLLGMQGNFEGARNRVTRIHECTHKAGVVDACCSDIIQD